MEGLKSRAAILQRALPLQQPLTGAATTELTSLQGGARTASTRTGKFPVQTKPEHLKLGKHGIHPVGCLSAAPQNTQS